MESKADLINENSFFGGGSLSLTNDKRILVSRNLAVNKDNVPNTDENVLGLIYFPDQLNSSLVLNACGFDIDAIILPEGYITTIGLPDFNDYEAPAAPVLPDPATSYKLSLRVFLQGAFTTPEIAQITSGTGTGPNVMTTYLNDPSLNILNNLYTCGGTHFGQGYEGATMLSGYTVPTNAVDIIKISLRTGTDVNVVAGDVNSTVYSTYAWLLNDGSIIDFYTGTDPYVHIPSVVPNNVYVVVEHRNHLGIMSGNTITLSSVIPTTIVADLSVMTNIWGPFAIGNNVHPDFPSQKISYMIAGDALKDSNFETNATDLFVVQLAFQVNCSGVLNSYTDCIDGQSADINLDGKVDVGDFDLMGMQNDFLWFTYLVY